MRKLKVPRINMLTNLSLKLPSGVCVIKVSLTYYENITGTVSKILVLWNSGLSTFKFWSDFRLFYSKV